MFRHHLPLHTILSTKGFFEDRTEPTRVNSSGAECRLRKRKNVEHLYRFSGHKFPMFSSTTTATFLLFSLHHHHHHISIAFPPPPPSPSHFYCFPPPPPPLQPQHFYCFPPPPPHFYCFPSTSTTTTSLLFSLHHHHHHHISIVFLHHHHHCNHHISMVFLHHHHHCHHHISIVFSPPPPPPPPPHFYPALVHLIPMSRVVNNNRGFLQLLADCPAYQRQFLLKTATPQQLHSLVQVSYSTIGTHFHSRRK